MNTRKILYADAGTGLVPKHPYPSCEIPQRMSHPSDCPCTAQGGRTPTGGNSTMYFLAIFPVLIILVLVGYTVEVSTGPSDFNFEWKALVVLSGLFYDGNTTAAAIPISSNPSELICLTVNSAAEPRPWMHRRQR